MFEKNFKNLHRDLVLVRNNLHTLPFVLGTPRWFLNDRYRFARPFSELNPRLYPFELLRIVLQAVISFIPATIALLMLLITLALNWIAEQFNVFLLNGLLRFILSFIRRLLNSELFAIRSPLDRLRERHADLQNTGVCVAVPKSGPHEVWIHVNGICEQGAMVDATCAKLKQFTGRMVNPFVNDSHGAPLDLLECILGRTLDCASRPALALFPRIIRQLALGRRVVLVAHSQAGIIVSNVVKRLVALAKVYGPDSTNVDPAFRWRNTIFAYSCERAEIPVHIDKPDVLHKAFIDGLSRVEVYTFGSAADEFEHGPFAEHFATELDFVARVGALHFSGVLDNKKCESWNGNVFMLRKELGAQGHLMKEMMLPAMKKGLFGHDSMFWQKYCEVHGAQHIPVDHHLIEEGF